MNRIGVCVLAGFLALILTSGAAWAQATSAQISGTVKDQSGAVLPGVEITATQTATGAKRSTVSNETGNYVLASLPLEIRPETGVSGRISSLGFVDNKISPSLLNPVAVNIAKTFPVTNHPCGRTLYGRVADQDEDLVTAKIDYTISPKHSIFGRFMLGNLYTTSTYDGRNPLSINTYGYKDYDYGFNLGSTYLIGNNMVNSLRIAANRTNIVKLNDNYRSWAGFGSECVSTGREHDRNQRGRRVHVRRGKRIARGAAQWTDALRY